MIGQLRISTLAMKWTMRSIWCPVAQPRIGGSTLEQWFDTRMKGPWRGRCSTPSTRAPNSRRARKPAMAEPGWKNQLRMDPLECGRDGIHALLNPELARVEHERAIRDSQGRHGATGVGCVAPEDLLQVRVDALGAAHLLG